MSDRIVSFILFGGGTLLILTFAMLGALLRDTFRGRSAAQRLGAEMGLEPPGDSRAARVWRVGEHDGRPFGVRVIGLPTGDISPNARRWRLWLSLVMAVDVQERIGFSRALAAKAIKSRDQFDEVFESSDIERVTSSARLAMLGFVLDRGPKPPGIQSFLNNWPKKRSLRLANRDDGNAWPKGFVDASVLADAPALLGHYHGYPNVTADGLRALLDEMGSVAEAVEA